MTPADPTPNEDLAVAAHAAYERAIVAWHTEPTDETWALLVACRAVFLELDWLVRQERAEAGLHRNPGRLARVAALPR